MVCKNTTETQRHKEDNNTKMTRVYLKCGSCLRNLKTPQKPFSRKDEGGEGLVVANFSVSGTLFLRSSHGQEVPVNLHPKNVIPCSDKKGQGPKAQLSTCDIQVLAKRRQISAASFLRPCSAVSVKDPSAQDPTGPQAAQVAGAGPPDGMTASYEGCYRH